MKNTFVTTLILLTAGLTVNDLAIAQQSDYLKTVNLVNHGMDECFQNKNMEACAALDRVQNYSLHRCREQQEALGCQVSSYIQQRVVQEVEANNYSTNYSNSLMNKTFKNGIRSLGK